MSSRIERWVKRGAGDTEQVAAIDVANDETLTVTYELAERVLKQLGFSKTSVVKQSTDEPVR